MEGDVEALVEVEVLARRLDDMHEELADALLALDAARADAAAARVAAEVADHIAAECRLLFEAMKRAKEAEGPGREQFTRDECRARAMGLNDAYVRARAYFAGAPLAGTAMVRVSAVVELLQGKVARDILDRAISADDACAQLAAAVKATISGLAPERPGARREP